MALPSNVGFGKVTGVFLHVPGDGSDTGSDPDGVPLAGLTVTFSASVTRVKNVSADPPVTIIIDTVMCTTDDNGVLVDPMGNEGVWLVASTDPDLDPTGWTWTATICSGTVDRFSTTFSLDVGQTLDLTTLIPVPSSPGTELAAWQQVVAQIRGEFQSLADEAAASASAAAVSAADARDRVLEHRVQDTWLPYSMDGGVVSVDLTIDAGATATVPVKFRIGRFALAPAVTATPYSNSNLGVSVVDVTLDGCTIQVKNLSSALVTLDRIHWHAVQMERPLNAGVQLIPGGGIGTLTPNLTRKVTYVQSSTDPGDADVRKLWNDQVMNNQLSSGEANLKGSIEHLGVRLPNCTTISLVVGWFLDFNTRTCKPMVELKNYHSQDSYTSGGVTYTREVEGNLIISQAQYDAKVAGGFVIDGETLEDEWSVAGLTRATADLLPVAYGESPSDADVVATIRYLTEQGYKVSLYPFLFGINGYDKPWRGRLTFDDATELSNFINGEWGYKNFIRHYLDLCADNGLAIDKFFVGSEMVGTTYSLPDEDYPFIDTLVELIEETHTKLPNAKATYAADWTEYHHDPANHLARPLDRVWAVADYVSIDAYFPLTETHTIDYDEIQAGWTSGEYWEYYYSGGDYTTRHPITSPDDAIKNISNWWATTHQDRGNQTEWVARSKQVLFSEIGFASVNATTVQPNKFVDPTSSESAYPRGSTEEADQVVQSVALRASLDWIATQPWTAGAYIWAWDTRPYPAFPNEDIWGDSVQWEKGHWIEGKNATQ